VLPAIGLEQALAEADWTMLSNIYLHEVAGQVVR